MTAMVHPEMASEVLAAARLTIPVLLGSVRRDRAGPRAAALVMRELERRGHAPVLVDPLELQLPLLDRMYKEYAPGEAPETLERLAQLYRRADGFLIVSGEYNHGIPPALKNLLDHFLEEYFWRPSGIVCYSAGGFGGVRAAMQLRMTLAELGMPSISSLLPIPRITQSLDENGLAADPITDRSASRFLDEFLWHAQALREARVAGTPY
jgi:NAD(P)H-dependent FMN reductase